MKKLWPKLFRWFPRLPGLERFTRFQQPQKRQRPVSGMMPAGCKKMPTKQPSATGFLHKPAQKPETGHLETVSGHFLASSKPKARNRPHVALLRIIATTVCAAMMPCAVFASADSPSSTTSSAANASESISQTGNGNSGNNSSTNGPGKATGANGTRSETSSQPGVGPQASCTETTWANWGTPFSGATGVPVSTPPTSPT